MCRRTCDGVQLFVEVLAALAQCDQVPGQLLDQRLVLVAARSLLLAALAPPRFPRLPPQRIGLSILSRITARILPAQTHARLPELIGF